MQPANATVVVRPGQRLYSAGGIRLLSFLFNTVVGGAMAAHNLKAVQRPKAARVAFWGSMIYSISTLFLFSQFGVAPAIPWLGWLAGLAGGLGLEAYCKRFIPDWRALPVKGNSKPIVVCLIITGTLFGLLLFVLRPH